MTAPMQAASTKTARTLVISASANLDRREDSHLEETSGGYRFVGHVKTWREDNSQEGRSLLVPNESRQAALWEVINDLHKYVGDLASIQVGSLQRMAFIAI